MNVNTVLELAKFYFNYPVLITLRGRAIGRSKLVRLVQAVLSQICDYSPVSVNNDMRQIENNYVQVRMRSHDSLKVRD